MIGMATLATAAALGQTASLRASAQEVITSWAAVDSTIYAHRYAHEGDHWRSMALLFHDTPGNAPQ